MRQREKYGRLSEADRVEIGGPDQERANTRRDRRGGRVFDQVGPTAIDTHRRTGAPGAKSFAAPPYGCRARGDLPGPDGGRLVPGDRRASGQSALNDLARSRRQWLERTIPGLEGGATGCREGTAPKGGEARPAPPVATEGGAPARRALVSTADCPSPSARSPLGSRDARVSRDDPPVAVRADARRAQEGTHGLPAHRPDATTIPEAQARRGAAEDMVSISERPAEAADRAVPGHWEGDLILGKPGRSAIGVLVERRSRYVFLPHLPGGRTAPHVRRAPVERMVTLPDQLRRSLTWDQGKEMAQHVRSASRAACRSTSAIRGAPGSAGPARTPTACSANTSPRAPISPPTHSLTSMPSPGSSMAALDKPSTG